MARFEWLTPERVMHAWGLAAVVGAFAVALMFLYLGFRAPSAFRPSSSSLAVAVTRC